jgi:hypothetical protein
MVQLAPRTPNDHGLTRGSYHFAMTTAGNPQVATLGFNSVPVPVPNWHPRYGGIRRLLNVAVTRAAAGTVRCGVPSFSRSDGCDGRGGDSVGPPPAQGVVKHYGGERQHAGGRAYAAERAVSSQGAAGRLRAEAARPCRLTAGRRVACDGIKRMALVTRDARPKGSGGEASLVIVGSDSPCTWRSDPHRRRLNTSDSGGAFFTRPR